MISLAYKISHCLSASHHPELRCVICTGVTLFAPVLHLNCTALSQSESSNFFMCIIIPLTYLFVFSVTCTFTNTLKFVVKDCDPSTGEPDEEGYEDEYVV